MEYDDRHSVLEYAVRTLAHDLIINDRVFDNELIEGDIEDMLLNNEVSLKDILFWFEDEIIVLVEKVFKEMKIERELYKFTGKGNSQK